MRTLHMRRALSLWGCLLVVLCAAPVVLLAQDSACLSELVPCLQYIGSKAAPSSGCCDPLKALIKSDPRCLCSMLGGSSTTRQAGVNTTQAQLLPARCGEKVNAALCTGRPNSKTTISSSAGELSLATTAMVAMLSAIFATYFIVSELEFRIL